MLPNLIGSYSSCFPATYPLCPFSFAPLTEENILAPNIATKRYIINSFPMEVLTRTYSKGAYC